MSSIYERVMDGKMYYDFMLFLFSDRFFSNKELCFVASFFWENLSEQYKDRWRNKSKKLKLLNIKISPFWLFAHKIKKSLLYRNLSYFEFIWPEISSEVKQTWASFITDKTWKKH
jgi:hypothetical protein